MEHVSSFWMNTLRIFEVRFALSKDVFQYLNYEIIVSKLSCQLYGDLTIHRQVIALVFVMILWFHFIHFSKNKTYLVSNGIVSEMFKQKASSSKITFSLSDSANFCPNV